MNNEKVMDMTHGPILSQMTRFMFPVLLGMLFQRIYNFADTYIVGHYLGDEALAAVSVGGSGTYMVFSLMIGATTGVGVVISQFYGAHQIGEIKKTFVSGIYVTAGMTAVVTLFGVLMARPLLKLLQTSEELMPQASIYLIIIYLGCCTTMLYNFIASVLRALGNSIVPLLFLIFSSVLNIILDILFVAWIPMGTAGAAFATVLAQLVSGVLCLIYAFRILPFLRIQKKEWKLDWYLAGQILRYGLPAGLQMSIISISDMILQAVINTHGTVMIVAYGVSMKVEGVGWQIAEAVGSAVSTFTGQNVGARNLERVKKGVRSAYLMNLIGYGIFCPLIFILAPNIVGCFTQTPEAIRLGAEYIRIFSFFFLIGGFLCVYHNLLRATGDVAITVLMGVSEVISRIVLAFLLPIHFGYRGLWFVSPLTWVCATSVGCIRYYSGAWKKKLPK